MCGRFTLIAYLPAVVTEFQVREVAYGYQPGNSISPGQQVAAVIRDPKTRLVGLRWGLIPSWASAPSSGNKLINARAESVATKPSFRDAFARRRCLIVADGFYEWQHLGRLKNPFHFALKSGVPFGFAGLYESWTAPTGEVVKTCTIITTAANELVRPVHDRMPVIVPKGKADLWLNPEARGREELEAILKPYPAAEMKMTAGFATLPLNNL